MEKNTELSGKRGVGRRECRVSRRAVLKSSVAALGMGAVSATPIAGNQSATVGGKSQLASYTGRRFRGLVRTGAGFKLEELRLLPVEDLEVVIRTTATQACYTLTVGLRPATPVQGPVPQATAARQRVTIPGHGGIGIVEAVGPLVKRVQPGDKVIVPETPQCGQCYTCLRGRADQCMRNLAVSVRPIAETSDGTPVFTDKGIGGFAELMVVREEWTVPIFTKVPDAELVQLHCPFGAGLAAGLVLAPIDFGSQVAVLGCGAVGMGAVQAARIRGAKTIVAVEPIRYRRELALKLGATIAVDPNAEGDQLVEKIRSLCVPDTDRVFAGGRNVAGNYDSRGPDYTFEAVGATQVPPKVESGPDPTGVLSMRQAWEMTRRAGDVVYLGALQRGDVSFPASLFGSTLAKRLHSGQLGGMNTFRDIPRFVRLAETGALDLKSITDKTFTLDKAIDAIQAAADRTVLSAVVVFS